MEEQEALDKNLKGLQTLLVGDNVGLVSSVGEQGKASEPQAWQGRFASSPPPQRARVDANNVSSRSQRISSEGSGSQRSPRGFIAVSPARKSTISDKQTHLARQPCRALDYEPGKGAATTAIWAHNKCDSRFFCLKFRRSEWFVPVFLVLVLTTPSSDLVTRPEASLNSELESAFFEYSRRRLSLVSFSSNIVTTHARKPTPQSLPFSTDPYS